MYSYSLRVRLFSVMLEWGISVVALMIFSLLAQSINDVLALFCGAIIFAIAALAVMPLATAQRLRQAWVVGAVIIFAGAVGTASVISASAIIVAFPLFGLIFLQRAIEIQDSADLARALVRWFRLESFGLPVLIVICLVIARTGSYLPSSTAIVGAVLYLILRIFGMLTIQRVELRRGEYAPSVQAIGFVVGVTLAVAAAAAAARWLFYAISDWIFYLLGLLVQFLSNLWDAVLGNTSNGQPHKMQIPKGLAPPKDPGQLAKQVGNPALPAWVWVALAVIMFLLILWLMRMYARKRTVAAEVHTQTVRTHWTPRPHLLFLSSVSYVRNRYQDVLRMLEQSGFSPLSAETPREYEERLSRQFPGATDSFLGSLRRLTMRYEGARYVDEAAASTSEASPDVRREVEEVVKVVESAVKQIPANAPGRPDSSNNPFL